MPNPAKPNPPEEHGPKEMDHACNCPSLHYLTDPRDNKTQEGWHVIESFIHKGALVGLLSPHLFGHQAFRGSAFPLGLIAFPPAQVFPPFNGWRQSVFANVCHHCEVLRKLASARPARGTGNSV